MRLLDLFRFKRTSILDESQIKEELFRKGAKAVMDVDCPRCNHTWLAGFKKSGVPTKAECPKCGWNQTMVISW